MAVQMGINPDQSDRLSPGLRDARPKTDSGAVVATNKYRAISAGTQALTVTRQTVAGGEGRGCNDRPWLEHVMALGHDVPEAYSVVA